MSKPMDGFLPTRQQQLGLVNSTEWLSIRKHNGLEIWFDEWFSHFYRFWLFSFSLISYSFLTFNSHTEGEDLTNIYFMNSVGGPIPTIGGSFQIISVQKKRLQTNDALFTASVETIFYWITSFEVEVWIIIIGNILKTKVGRHFFIFW